MVATLAFSGFAFGHLWFLGAAIGRRDVYGCVLNIGLLSMNLYFLAAHLSPHPGVTP